MFLPTNRGAYFAVGDQSYFLPYYSGPGPPTTSERIPELLHDEPAMLQSRLPRIESPDVPKHLNFGITQILGNDISETFPSNALDHTSSSERYGTEVLALQHRILQEACSLDLKSHILKDFKKFDFPACFPLFTQEANSYISYPTENALYSNNFEESKSQGPAPEPSEAGPKYNQRGVLRRAVFSEHQKNGLEERFQIRKYISKLDRKTLSEKLFLKDSQVKVWFQNRRMKWRNSKDKTHLGDTQGSFPMMASDGEASVTPSSSDDSYYDKQRSSNSSSPHNLD